MKLKLEKLERLMLDIEQHACGIGDEVELSIMRLHDGYVKWFAAMNKEAKNVVTATGDTPIKAVRALRDELVEAGEDLLRLKEDGR